MPRVIFWDVDTQYDFIMPDGDLYVTGAEAILPNLQRLTRHAQQRGIPIFGSVDNHRLDDPEISDRPDFQNTFPPHCIAGTSGQQKVPETRPRNPLWIDPDAPADLIAQVQNHRGEILFRKQRFDVFTNLHVDPVLNAIAPDRIVLYGVALDVCNAHAINGFLKRDTAPIQLVRDATQAIIPERGDLMVAEWRQRGVEVVSTDHIVNP